MSNDQANDEELEGDIDRYILNAQDRKVVTAAEGLLLWIVRSSIVLPNQLVGVKKVLLALQELPRAIKGVSLSVNLSGPRRWYGEHEIRHWWEVRVDEEGVE